MKGLKICLLLLGLPCLIFAIETPEGWHKDDRGENYPIIYYPNNSFSRSNDGNVRWGARVYDDARKRSRSIRLRFHISDYEGLQEVGRLGVIFVDKNTKKPIEDIEFFTGVNDECDEDWIVKGGKNLALKLLNVARYKGELSIVVYGYYSNVEDLIMDNEIPLISNNLNLDRRTFFENLPKESLRNYIFNKPWIETVTPQDKELLKELCQIYLNN